MNSCYPGRFLVTSYSAIKEWVDSSIGFLKFKKIREKTFRRDLWTLHTCGRKNRAPFKDDFDGRE